VNVVSEAYKQAGVDIDAGNEAVERMKKHVKRTFRPEVLADLGGFGGLFALNNKYENPILVSGTDGVGTKLKLAFALDKHDTIGIDAVAMCVNDIIVQGAEPLFFLDYLATGKLVPSQIESIVAGISEGCVQSGCALIGGETAEMPGMYTDGEYDIAGFAVGIVDRSKLIDGSKIKAGDVILGLASSGVHSNGFSLVRHLLLEQKGYKLDQNFDELGGTLGETLLTPTRLYVKQILNVMNEVEIKGLVHITGGGFTENIPRVLPANVNAHVVGGTWPVLPIFQLMQREGNITDSDMYKTFNMGIGMVVIVDAADAEKTKAAFEAQGESVYTIGQVTEGDRRVTYEGIDIQ
jgi:phosphoribosylformylglycinamidine cyclo-ligase